MSKIFALYTNELIKLKSKISTWILLTLMILASFLSPLILGRIALSEVEQYAYYGWENLTKEQITHLRDSLSKNLGDMDNYIHHETIQYSVNNEMKELFSTYLSFSDGDLYSYGNYLVFNSLLAGYDFDAYPLTDTALSNIAFQEYRDYQGNINDENAVPFAERDAKWFSRYEIYTKCLDLCKKALFSHDYAPLAESYKLNGEQTQADYINTLARIDPKGELSMIEAQHVYELLLEQTKDQDNLRTGTETVSSEIDSRRVLLSASKRQILEERIQIIDHLIEKKNTTNTNRSIALEISSLSQSIGRFFLIVLLIIAAGGCISQELASGSIKSLIIAPVKRWKIFLAKLLSVLSVVIVGSILLNCMTTLGTLIQFGSDSLPSYFYYSNGVVKELPFFLYSLLHFLIDNLPLFIYVLTAFTISCMTKNTALSVGVSMSLILFNSIGSTFLSLFGQKRWIDFLPFSNMNLSPYIFPHETLIGKTDLFQSDSLATNNSLLFSVVYLVILVCILLLTAYDGFVKKDIS